MNQKGFYSIIGLVFAMISILSMIDSKVEWDESTKVYDLLQKFGEPLPPHAPKAIDDELIQKGKDLVFKGRTLGPNGKKSRYISKFYTCTSCHSPIQEDPNLKVFDPQARLEYAAKNKLKFLQGSTFYGIANRESWYNDDYVLKYGDLVKPASESLSESTQLCAKVCSSGRYLEDWELEAILAYYWDNQLKVKDLSLTEDEEKQLKNKIISDQDAIALIKSKYALKSPATFGKIPEDQMKGYGLEGNPENGKLVFELSCQSCHQERGVSGMTLETDKVTFQKFKRHLSKNTDYNLYNIVRHGTYAGEGKPRYMPLYPEERLSNQQLEDLKAYILKEAG